MINDVCCNVPDSTTVPTVPRRVFSACLCPHSHAPWETSQEVTHPIIVSSQARLTLEFLYDELPNKKQFSRPYKAQGQQKPQGQAKKPGQQKQLQISAAPKTEDREPCKQCNRLHYGKCMWGTFKCFICKEEGHKAADCPRNKGPTIGRAYVMHAEEAEAEPDSTLITGEHGFEETGGADD